MENRSSKKLKNMVAIIISLILTFTFSAAVAMPVLGNEMKPKTLSTYIVYVTEPDQGRVSTQSMGSDLDSWYKSFLPVSTASSDEEPRMVYSYKNVVSGFAAKLTATEVKDMETKQGFLSAHVEKILPLHTTNSPNFLGLQQNFGFWKDSNFGKGVIIGVLDTGITPGHPSFSDLGVPPPPPKWKGRCELPRTACNNKLIGARDFVNKTGPPLDDEGHGTHTASTAGGNFVKGANVFGQASGQAAGVAPLAHLAIYRVCSSDGCSESNILAAMDAAIADGVDVISLSIGGGSTAFYADSIAVAAYSAVQKGIFVSCSAGNAGPAYQSLSNEAPWILTVGASTIDRSILATAMLGNGKGYDGETVFQPTNFPPKQLPLFDASSIGGELSGFCAPGSLSGSNVKGKVVLCEKGGGVAAVEKGQVVKDAGGAAMILMNDETIGHTTFAEPHVLPATHVSFEAGTSIRNYISSTPSPTATIMFKGTVIGNISAPEVAAFSSRGPSIQSPGILKPDIVGPGVNILAAWPISIENKTNTKLTFNMISGTSMACPHLSGVAALLKSTHPDWSAAAIKSAMMTSADTLNIEGKPIFDQKLAPANVFSMGAGHVNPSKANDPGFIYDIQPDDYIPYLCGLNYNDKQVGAIVRRAVQCSKVPRITEAQLNYPSFSIKMVSSTPQTYSRTVTNVGKARSFYRAQIIAPPGINLVVKPNVIAFTAVNQKMTYNVTFSKTTQATGHIAQGFLDWISPDHTVKTPIIVSFE